MLGQEMLGTCGMDVPAQQRSVWVRPSLARASLSWELLDYGFRWRRRKSVWCLMSVFFLSLTYRMQFKGQCRIQNNLQEGLGTL